MGSLWGAARMVSLRHTYEQGSLRIAFYCVRPTPYGVCNNRSEISIETALKRWGPETHLGEIRARCSRCGSNEFFNVRGEPSGRPGKRGRR
jgi:hypothetical protein